MKITFEELLLQSPQSVKDMLEELKGLRENPQYHPELNCFIHIEIVTNRLIDSGDIDLIVSGFFHDLFKLKCKVINKKTGHPSSPLHDIEVANFIRTNNEVRDFISATGANVETVTFICENHMMVKRLDEMRNSKRWALMKHELFDKLCLFTLADKMSNDWEDCLIKHNDYSSRMGLMIGNVSGEWIYREFDRMAAWTHIGLTAEHLITGKDLIRMGYPQGKVIGMAIKIADEKFADDIVTNVLEKFRLLILNPQEYIDDENLGIVAKELISQMNIV